MRKRNPPEWLDELLFAMDTARELLRRNDWDFANKMQAEESYEDMRRYIDRHPTRKYVEECRSLCEQLEPYLPS